MTDRPPVPVTVVTGFLGAGKTTLVNAITTSAAAQGRRMGLIVNDFGAVNLDASELDTKGSTVLALEGGCVCCSLSAGFTSAVLALTAREPRPEHILVEASGVSDPLGIVLPMMAGGMQPLVRLAAVVAVVDVGQVGAWPSPEAEALARAQVGGASVVVMTKTEAHGEPARWAAEDWVRGLAPKARLLDADDLDPTLLLDLDDDVLVGLLDAAARQRPQARHLDTFDTWTFEAEGPLASVAALRRALAELPTEVVRAKGLVAVTDSARPLRFHLVGRMLATRLADDWPEGWTPGTGRVAVLGAAGTLDDDALDSAFSDLLTAHA